MSSARWLVSSCFCNLLLCDPWHPRQAELRPNFYLSDSASCFYLSGGNFFGALPGSETTSSNSGMKKCAPGDKVRLVLDTAAGTLAAYKNGVEVPSHISGLGGKSLSAFVSLCHRTDQVRVIAE